jgi:hypothetical protein
MVISDNNIGSITVSNSSTGRVEMAGIYAQGAATSYTITGNNIGSSSTANSMQNNTTSDSYGIYASSTATNSNTFSNNTVANVNSTGAFYGIRSDGGTNTISTNTVQDINSAANDVWGINTGSSTINNNISGNTIFNLATGARAIGIRTDGGVNTISNNTVRNNSSSSATSQTSAIGIWMNSTTAGQTATGNTIHSLQNTTPTAATATAQGIYYTGPTSGTNVIERNNIHSLSLATSSNSGAIYGIRVLTGTFPVNIQNNMVRLGIDAAGADITTGYAIFGIGNASSSTTNHYFNTIYIGGSGVTGTTSNTFALLSSGVLNTRAFQNNILVNARDGGATGNHYAFQIGGSGVNPAGLTMNYNLYQVTGANSFIGSYNAGNLGDLTAVQTTIGQDANSWVCDPQLINPTGNVATVNLHILAPPVKTLIEANGLVIGGITVDFDGQTRSALTPTDIGADAGNFSQQTGGCAITLTWNGSVSDVWTVAANWTPALAPTVTTPVIIPGGVTPQPAITGTVNALSVILNGTASPSIASGGILNIRGDASGIAPGAFTGLGKIVFNGTVQQNVSGTFTVSNVDFANTTAQGVVIASGATLRVEPNAANGTGLVTFLNNSRINNNGKFILGSNSTATAKIGIMPATTFIIGDVTIERYLPYTTQVGQWYLMGSSMSGKNFTDYVDDFRLVGLSTGFGLQGNGILPSVEPERSFIFKYDEATHNVRLDTVQKQGWVIPGNENVTPGTGYRIWVNSASNTTHKVDNEGTFTQGNFNFPAITRTNLSGCLPATFPCNEVNLRGWNLLANPYPCDINWDATGGAWTKPSQMNNAFYTYNSAANAYRVYLGTTGTAGVGLGSTSPSSNTAPNVIASGQAFFVNVTTAGSFTLSLTENAKITATNGTFTRNAVAENQQIRIRMKNTNSDNRYDAMVRISENATDAFDANLDLVNFAGAGFNLSIKTETAENLILSSIAPISGTKTIPLNMAYNGTFGNYSLEFTELETLLENHSVFLRDNLLGLVQPISAGTVYNFVTNASEGNSSNRFELVFQTDAVTSVNAGKSGISMNIYPNPSDSKNGAVISVAGFESSKAELIISDVLGKIVVSKTIALQANGTTEYQLKENLPAGVYTVKTTGGKKTSTQKWIVK